MNDTERDQAVEKLRVKFVAQLNDSLPANWKVMAKGAHTDFQFLCELNGWRRQTPCLDFVMYSAEELDAALRRAAALIIETYQRDQRKLIVIPE